MHAPDLATQKRPWYTSPPFVAWATTRGFLFLFSWISLSVRPFPFDNWPQLRAYPWLDGLNRWDAEWYWSIASNGYVWIEGQQTNLAFFPLYPLVAKAVSLPLVPWMGDLLAYYSVAIALAAASFLLASIGLYKLALAYFDETIASRAVWLLCLFPFSYFFSAAYPEALFLALSVWAFVFAERRQWGLAFALAGLAALARPTGILAGAALLILYLISLRSSGWKLTRQSYSVLWAPAIWGVYLIFLWVRFGHPLKFLHALQAWGGDPFTGPIRHVLRAVEGQLDPLLSLLVFLQVVLAVASLLLAVSVYRRMGAAYAFYVVASIASAVVYGFVSSGRRMAVVFPVFIGLALVFEDKPRLLYTATAVIFGVLQFSLFQAFIYGGPVY